MNTWVWLTVVILAIVVLGFVAVVVLQKRRTERLQTSFGPEYDRTVDDTGDRRQAEAELTQRAKRRSSFEVRPLPPEAREKYSREWEHTQAHFVDEPLDAVARADQEIMQVMRERGYPIEDFDQRTADISVDHPKVVEGYRAAHDVATSAAAGKATTEDLRVAMVHYRALFDDLLNTDDDRSRGPEGHEDTEVPTQNQVEEER